MFVMRFLLHQYFQLNFLLMHKYCSERKKYYFIIVFNYYYYNFLLPFLNFIFEQNCLPYILQEKTLLTHTHTHRSTHFHVSKRCTYTQPNKVKLCQHRANPKPSLSKICMDDNTASKNQCPAQRRRGRERHSWLIALA